MKIDRLVKEFDVERAHIKRTGPATEDLIDDVDFLRTEVIEQGLREISDS